MIVDILFSADEQRWILFKYVFQIILVFGI